jgi:prepilin-type processing-associated H-X9-DG protein
MAAKIDHLIEPTEKGVKVELKTLYMYPDGHANLLFADGTDWPIADEYQLVQVLAGGLLRPMVKQARRLHRS